MVMASKNTAQTASPFETEDESVAVAEQPREQPAPVAAAKETSTAVAVAATSAGASSALALAIRKGTDLDGCQGVFPQETLETMGIGAFPRVTVDQGGFSRNKTDFLGAWIDFELISWNLVTLVTCNVQNDKEADKLIRSSYDHKTIPGTNQTVDEYVAELKEMGYKDAGTKKYAELYGMLHGTDKKGAFGDEAGMVQLSASPQSLQQWQRFLLESRINVAKGKVVGTRFFIGSERRTIGSNTFGVMQFGKKG